VVDISDASRLHVAQRQTMMMLSARSTVRCQSKVRRRRQAAVTVCWHLAVIKTVITIIIPKAYRFIYFKCAVINNISDCIFCCSRHIWKYIMSNCQKSAVTNLHWYRVTSFKILFYVCGIGPQLIRNANRHVCIGDLSNYVCHAILFTVWCCVLKYKIRTNRSPLPGHSQTFSNMAFVRYFQFKSFIVD